MSINIPNYLNLPFVDSNGKLSDSWSLILQNLITQLQTNFNNGFLVPQYTATQISDFQSQFAAATNPSQFYGCLVYDTDNNLLKVNIAGTFKTVTTS